MPRGHRPDSLAFVPLMPAARAVRRAGAAVTGQHRGRGARGAPAATDIGALAFSGPGGGSGEASSQLTLDVFEHESSAEHHRTSLRISNRLTGCSGKILADGA